MTTDMTDKLRVQQWIMGIAALIASNQDPSEHYCAYFIDEPELITVLIELLMTLDDDDSAAGRAYYSACVFAVDVCVAQLQSAQENGNKHAARCMQHVMELLAKSIQQTPHGIMFWLPIVNVLYDVHAELSPALKAAYLDLVNREEALQVDSNVAHLNSIRELMHELADLSVFDMAEHFFAQSYAMPVDFFSDLVLDLYSIEEGEAVGLLCLLHPDYAIREVVVGTLAVIMPRLKLTSIGLSRLQAITAWYPPSEQAQLKAWIKQQRKQGVVFNKPNPAQIISIKASEIDGGGAQGVFIHVRRGRVHRLCGMLFKYGVGIKDAWITPPMPRKDVAHYHGEVFDETILLRDVDEHYLMQMANHFLAVMIDLKSIPDLHLLEIQEEIGLSFTPQRLEIPQMMSTVGVQISPFTPEVMASALARSKTWFKTKRFTESWYLENPRIDKSVNQCCSFVDGVRVCRLEEAIALVFQDEFELQRDRWVFHFLWVALWLKVKSRPQERAWQDSFLIAYAIQSEQALATIPIMLDICHQSVINSMETMHERKTHLN